MPVGTLLQGQIAEVNLDVGAVLRYFDTGGQPTRGRQLA